ERIILSELEAKDPALAERAVRLLKSGNLSAMWGGGRGGRASDPARPGERYPEPAPEAAAEEEPEGAGAAAARPDPSQLRNVIRDLYYGLRARGVPLSFRGSGQGGSEVAEPGEYTVALTIGDRTWTTSLRVVGER
ncbi:MAG: hypothetical protein ACOC3J_04435, partial [Gemmatimonadota bacterium]